MNEFAALKKQAFNDIVRVMGDSITYHFASGLSLSCCAVFSEVDIELQDGQGVIDSRVLTATISKCFFENNKPRQDDRLTFKNITYDVRRVVENSMTNYTLYLFEHDTTYQEVDFA